MNFDKVVVIGSSKGTFAGSATIKIRFFRLLIEEGIDCVLLSQSVPPEYFAHDNRDIKIEVIENVNCNSEANAFSLLYSDLLINRIIHIALETANSGKLPILWGTGLFPYGGACLAASAELERRAVRHACIQFPVGADMWEIGPGIPFRVNSILNSKNVGAIATYSQRFADEINDHYKINRKFDIISPYLDSHRFFEGKKEAIFETRRELGVGEDDVLLVHHSNMRPIKRLNLVLEMFARISELMEARVCLLLIGPNPGHKYVLGDNIIDLDLITDVSAYLQASDFAINCSVHDSFNTALLEALGCGTIPITSSAPAISEAIEEYDAGFVFSCRPVFSDVIQWINDEKIPKDFPVEAVVKYMANIMGDTKRRETVKENGRLLIQEKFSSYVCKENLLKLLQAVH